MSNRLPWGSASVTQPKPSPSSCRAETLAPRPTRRSTSACLSPAPASRSRCRRFLPGVGSSTFWKARVPCSVLRMTKSSSGSCAKSPPRACCHHCARARGSVESTVIMPMLRAMLGRYSRPPTRALRLACLVDGPAEASVPRSVDLRSSPQGAAVHLGPELVEHHDLRVGGLPQQEVRGPQLPARAQEEVDVGHVGLVEEARDRLLGDLLGIEAPCLHLARDGLRGVGDLGSPAVVHAHRERAGRVVARELLGRLELGDHRAPQARTTPCPAHPHPPLVHHVAPAPQHVAVEAHEEAHLLGRALPV